MNTKIKGKIISYCKNDDNYEITISTKKLSDKNDMVLHNNWQSDKIVYIYLPISEHLKLTWKKCFKFNKKGMFN